MADKRTLEILQTLSPFNARGEDLVSTAARNVLLNYIKTESRFHEVFFPLENSGSYRDIADMGTFPLLKYGTAYISQTISKVKDEYKFHTTINKTATEDFLRDIYYGLQWKKLGFSLYTLVYPETVKDPKTGLTINDYLDDESHIWAEKLIADIMDPRWTRNILQKIIKGKYTDTQYNRDMNELFVKLHILDPQSVIPAYQFLLSQRALPAVNLELATRNYLGGPLDINLIKPEVETAIRKPSVPLNVSRLSLTEVEVFHGVQVDEFVVTQCRNQGFWSGLRPENYRISRYKDRCSIM
ncbi:uncharacterized protein LOC126812658 [Patella vulgata]|uniref:uncharacterized protein LOC126812658 n=1 Tax=Patella vulgata TaxID=6465 RepID=UPI0024A9F293|nr:uncharacterized protein LOC126812658 [Patella vulgata]XP_055957422.1 uncharacterized protein LOC126812658 [Patella vulgata]